MICLHIFIILTFKVLLSRLFSLLLLSYQLIEHLGIVVVDILVDACFQSLHQLLFYLLFNVCCDQCLCLSDSVSSLSFLLDGHDLLLTLEPHFSHLDEHLSQFSKSLLALVDDEWRPIDQLSVNLIKGLLIIFIELNFFPKFIGLMCTFCSLHVQVTDAFLFPDGGVLGVGEGTWFAIA